MRWRARPVRIASIAALTGLAAATSLPALAELHWLPELLSHFRLQLAVAAAFLLLCSALLRMAPGAVVAALCLGVNVLPMLPFLLPSGATSQSQLGPTIRLLLLNVQATNRETHRVRDLIQSERADIICLLEVDRRWISELDELADTYPYSFLHPQENRFGIALFSRIPFDRPEIRDFGTPSVPAFLGHFELGRTPVSFLAAHAAPPLGARYAALRNRQLKGIPALRQEFSEREFIVIGDLNTTPWSPHFRELESAAALQSASKGLGIHPTWPAGAFPLRIPIDHVIISDGLRAVSYQSGPPSGSDHLPVIVELRETRPSASRHASRGIQ